jgi:hypothetical protein
VLKLKCLLTPPLARRAYTSILFKLPDDMFSARPSRADRFTPALIGIGDRLWCNNSVLGPLLLILGLPGTDMDPFRVRRIDDDLTIGMPRSPSIIIWLVSTCRVVVVVVVVPLLAGKWRMLRSSVRRWGRGGIMASGWGDGGQLLFGRKRSSTLF